MDVDCAGRGAAKRRRDRRLRAWHRHVKMTVAVEVATALHHSAQPAGPVVGGPREEAGHKTHFGLRAATPLPPGTRPAPLSDVAGPQRSDRTVRRSAGEPPHAVVPSLAVDGGGVIDGASIRFLLSQTLLKREDEKAKEDEKKAKKVKEEEKIRALDARVAAGLPLTDAQWAAWHRGHGIPPKPSSSSSGGKRRKRKKTKNNIITNKQQPPPQHHRHGSPS